MSIAMLFQICLNLFFALGLFVAFRRLNRPAKDDPRLSRGLQLLQSKIAILEDLSDRTEVQVSQLVALMEHKCKDVQSKIQAAERQIHLINASMEKSLDVAKIFQDKIPHQEIIERQNTIKYVQAARMAHQGASLDDIRSQVDLPLGELEFIIKVNRAQLMFSEADLPTWAQQPTAVAGGTEAPPAQQSGPGPVETVGEAGLPSTIMYQSQIEQEERDAGPQRDLSQIFEVQRPEMTSLEMLGEKFRQAVEEQRPAPPVAVPAPISPAGTFGQQPAVAANANINPIANRSALGRTLAQEAPVIRKVQFPRINVSDNLK